MNGRQISWRTAYSSPAQPGKFKPSFDKPCLTLKRRQLPEAEGLSMADDLNHWYVRP
jgi:hypothetical protein